MEKLVNKVNQSILKEIINSELIKDKPKHQKSKKKDKEGTIEENIKVHYFLITELLPNENYEKLFAIQQETPNFSIKELKTTPNEEAITQNNIIKVKNFFCSLLYNYFKLIKTDFDEGKTENTIDILQQLNIFMQSSNFVVDRTIPFEWYISSLFEYLKKIPDDLTKNDFENLYKEIENDVNKSIKELDFEALSVIIGKLKFTERGEKYYKNVCELLKDIKLNEEAKQIIESEFIPVEMKFNLNDEELEGIEDYDEDNEKENNKDKKNIGNFEINHSNFKEKDKDKKKIKDYEKVKKVRLCLTIEELTKKFPNIRKYQELQDADIFLIQKLLDFPKQLDKYFEIVKKNILEKKKFEDEDNVKINEKIYDYVMSKIYDKIFPEESIGDDMKIYQSAIRLSWTEPKHFIIFKKELVFGSFLKDVLKFFKLMDSEKSPRKKFLNLKEIYNSVVFLLKFNGVGADAGVDDQLPIINYSIVKSHELRLNSNSKFMKLYIGEKKSKLEGSQLAQLSSACSFIANLKYTDLIGVSYDEFVRNCNEATIKDDTKKN